MEDRYEELGSSRSRGCVPFENRGVEGVTLQQPTADYAYPFVPPCRQGAQKQLGTTAARPRMVEGIVPGKSPRPSG